MALQYKVPASGMDERWWQARFEEPIGTEDTEIRNTFMPAEWFPQSGVQLTWPHAETDWCDMLEEVTECYIKMAYEIASREPLLIVTPEQKKVERLLRERLPSHILSQIIWCECPTNDTWARDHGFI
ncbi:MAG: agmatine deiminase family protein, partial [Paraprevotella sp.]|nr:agmatine deiminase family protein [Paraprevotella sp.]